jgi:hypothetical protein
MSAATSFIPCATKQSTRVMSLMPCVIRLDGGRDERDAMRDPAKWRG